MMLFYSYISSSLEVNMRWRLSFVFEFSVSKEIVVYDELQKLHRER